MQIYLDLRLPTAFDCVEQWALLALAAPRAAAFFALDEVRAAAMLANNWEEASPAQVVASLQEAARAAAGAEGTTASASADGVDDSAAAAAAPWRLRLHRYLEWLRRRDAGAAAPFAALQVDLHAAHDPAGLLPFLAASSDYPLDEALAVCERAGLVRESVYVLGRMGAADRALRLIVGQLRDVEQAVAFVQEAREPELWELLVSLALGDAALAGELLDHAGG